MDGLDKNECCVACGEVMILARATSQFFIFMSFLKKNSKASSNLKCFLLKCFGLGPSSTVPSSWSSQGLTLLGGAKISFWENKKLQAQCRWAQVAQLEEVAGRSYCLMDWPVHEHTWISLHFPNSTQPCRKHLQTEKETPKCDKLTCCCSRSPCL